MADRSAEIVTETAKRIKAFRESEGLTQTKFGEMINKDQSTILRYESGRLSIPIDVIIALNRIFGMNLEWLLTGKGGSKDKPEKSNLVTDIKTLNENNLILMNEIKTLKIEFKKLHKEFFEFKHGLKK